VRREGTIREGSVTNKMWEIKTSMQTTKSVLHYQENRIFFIVTINTKKGY
jgi:hypothetical protein